MVSSNESAAQLSVADTLRGKTLFVIGATGFLGKVYLHFLLSRHADLEKIYLLIRPKKGITPQERLENEVFTSECFDPLRKRLGQDAYLEFVREKVIAIGGDITLKHLGIDERIRRELNGKIDVLVNSSGLVDFNPPLEEGLEINALGVLRSIEVAQEWDAHYLAVSTCYVAGQATGSVFEDKPVYGFFPKQDEMPGVTFDPRREIEEGLQIIKRTREEAYHQEHQNAFKHEARNKLIKDHRNPDDPEALKDELERVRKRWVNQRLSDIGMRRSLNYGWPNTYTYTKSLGEQLVVSTPGLRYSIVRPAIIESSYKYPFPGWNEGINTTAPLVFLVIQGQLNYPTKDKNVLDVIPVDMIAGPMVVVTAALIENTHHEVYQLGSSDLNPLTMRRVVELTGLHKRQYYQNRSRGNPILNEIYGRIEPQVVSLPHYNRASTAAFSRWAGGAAKALSSTGLSNKLSIFKRMEKSARSIEKNTKRIDNLVHVFLPFIWDFKYRFKNDNILDLYTRLSPEDRESYPFDPAGYDWLEYWLDVHVLGLETWVFPKIKDKLKRKPLPKVYRYEDLVELFDATTTNNSEKVAFRMLQDSYEETYTYGQVRERAGWVAAFLKAKGTEASDRVLIVSENRPEWGMSYFGILQLGATAVPVDSKATGEHIANLARSAKAKGIIISHDCRAQLEAKFEELGLEIPLWSMNDVFIPPTDDMESVALVPATQKKELASLIYTSGTTGDPKGVMLSHHNMSSLLSSLAKLFRLNDRDRMLSVLPLHHTFEFTAGFLLPLSRGSTITYLKTLNGDTLSEALKGHKITAMVGVPALWELIHRKIQSQVEDRGALAEILFLGLTNLHRALRDKLGVNLGKTVFGEVHRGLGGHIRYMISGGAALPADVFDGFNALGMDLYEGYGLTEASPVLAVNRPGYKPIKNSVGSALPGVELKILDPNDEGLGEVIARGPNVMQGYFGNEEATGAVIKQGWLHTGDIGRIDRRGNLFIVGRAKEVIVDSSGKNVYPDEVETIYGGFNYLKEISVVGLPDGRGSERVAAMVVFDVEKAQDASLSMDKVRERFDAHIRHVEMTLPYPQRIKVMRFSEKELPRTATRKIKRRDVLKLLQAILEREAEQESAQEKSTTSTGNDQNILDTLKVALARITGKKASDITPKSKLDADLGLDSLMATELIAALEDHGGQSLELQDLVEAGTVAGIAELLKKRSVMLPVLAQSPDKRMARAKDIFHVSLKRVHEVQVPEDIRIPVKSALGHVQKAFYGMGFDVKVKGRGFLPQATNVLVISNHTSHLDMGLVKHALGGYGKNLISLAAADYFFADGPMRFYFENFTNAVPLDRIVPKRESIRRAQLLLEQGNNLLMFPEGTRSPAGGIQPFKRGVGMMSLRFGVDVLPVYIHGTHRALPKGAMFPKSRDLEVRIGAPVSYKDLARLTEGMPPLQAQTMVSRLLQQAVEALRDNVVFDLEVAAENEGVSRNPLEALMVELQGKFKPESYKDEATYYFSLGGQDGDKWTLKVDEDGAHYAPGRPENADCVLKTSADIFTRIVREGYAPGVSDFMSGQIKTNDLVKLTYFQELFGLGGL